MGGLDGLRRAALVPHLQSGRRSRSASIPQGRFIRRYLPELAGVPDRFLHAPWTMPPLEQQAAGCVIGRDYPAPIVDHGAQRERALALFQAART